MQTDSGGRLVTAARFDREITPSINFQLVCSVAIRGETTVTSSSSSNNNSSSQLFTVTQNVTLMVVDEDDNPPRLQSPDVQSVVDVYLKEKGIEMVYFDLS